MQFNNAIVRIPCESMVHGLTNAQLGKPDYHKALAQHRGYIQALQECGLQVNILDADEKFPDSTFVEDTALLTAEVAIITNPGAPSRKGEIVEIQAEVAKFYSKIETINDPGTLDGGDIMMVGSHFYIGLSERTNEHGARQAIDILEKFGMHGSTVSLEKVLHLKTGLSYLEDNNLVVSGEFLEKPEFQQYNQLVIDKSEAYAANCVWINQRVLVPGGYPHSIRMIEKAGYSIIEVDMSEFQKLDGGLSCLSLRF